MNRTKRFIVIIIILTVAVGLGLLVNGCSKEAGQVEKKEIAAKVSYWTCAMHPSVHSERAGKCPICGMELIPVYKEKKPETSNQIPQKEEAYYGCGAKEEGHCPHCDEGKADAGCICGGHSFVMEDVQMNCPVCGRPLKKLEPEEVQRIDKAVISRVKLNKEMIERAGIFVEQVKRYHLAKTMRTVGKIAFDPELAVAQEEFLTALETREKISKSPDVDVINRAEDIVNKSKLKLRLMGLSDEEIKALEESRIVEKSLILPQDKAWVYADIYEYDIGWVKEGQVVRVTTVAFPGEEFKGTIKSITPVLDPKTRSVKARIEVQNPEKKLKPEMYVDVIIESTYVSPDGSHEVLAVPKEVILDTGTRKIIYVAGKEGEYLGKEVKVGPEAVANVEGKETRLYPILSGLGEGELVVRKGNFLIDSQSQLTGGMSVLWGGAQEIKTESAAPSKEAALVETKHKH